jgi:hypothetical protein
MQNKDAYQGTNYAGCSGTDTYPAGTEHPCKGLCPTGFHVPTWPEFDDAYNKFSSYYGCSNDGCWNKDSQWEGVIGGMCDEAGTLNSAGDANYWGSTEQGMGDPPYNDYQADYLLFSSGRSEVACIEKNVGLALRCVSSQVNPPFSAGSITTGAATVFASVNPNVTIGNSSDASGGDGSITYEWRRSGTSSATLTGSASTYTIGSDADNYSTAGTYYFTRWANDGRCSTGWEESSGAYTLTVEPLCTDCKIWTTCSTCTPGFIMISNKKYEGSGAMDWSTAEKHCRDNGGRLPTHDELKCICKNKNAPLPGSFLNNIENGIDPWYWSSTPTYPNDPTISPHFYMDFKFGTNCDPTGYGISNNEKIFVKCVK